jgi:glutathione S-transferase
LTRRGAEQNMRAERIDPLMSLVFYYAPFSSATMSHWALEELGIPYEKVKLDLKNGESHKPEFLALNPNGKVPTIVHDGTAIFETVAIVAYLGETFGVDKGLYPPPGPRRGEALKWIVWANVSVGEALARFQRNTVDRIPEEQRNAKAAEVAKADVEKLLGILDGALQGKSFLVGDSFSLADLHVAAYVSYVGMCGFDSKPWPALDAWLKSATSRPLFGKVMRPDA